jgi:hypothetical protein
MVHALSYALRRFRWHLARSTFKCLLGLDSGGGRPDVANVTATPLARALSLLLLLPDCGVVALLRGYDRFFLVSLFEHRSRIVEVLIAIVF